MAPFAEESGGKTEGTREPFPTSYANFVMIIQLDDKCGMLLPLPLFKHTFHITKHFWQKHITPVQGENGSFVVCETVQVSAPVAFESEQMERFCCLPRVGGHSVVSVH